jgi:hypothetical protein
LEKHDPKLFAEGLTHPLPLGWVNAGATFEDLSFRWETPMEFFDGDLLDARGDRPLVAERINHCRHSVAVDNVARFLDRSRTGFHGTPVNNIDVGDVHIERAASWLTLFEGLMTEMTESPIRIVM